MQNILGRKLISCELLLRLYFKLKNNNIRTNRFWVQKSFMERKESSIFWYLKLFDHEFLSSSSTLLVFIFIFYSDVSQCLFCFLLVAFSNSLADNTREYLQNGKKFQYKEKKLFCSQKVHLHKVKSFPVSGKILRWTKNIGIKGLYIL